MTPVANNMSTAQHNNLQEFEQYAVRAGFYPVHVEYINAQHLVFSRPASNLPVTVENLLMRLLDEYMPTGILHIREVSNAREILHKIRRNLEDNEPVGIDLSEQFYQIVPQNGNLARLEAINSWRMYENKIEVVNRLESALNTIYIGVQSAMNPIEYFKRQWLRTELIELDLAGPEFSNLNRRIEATNDGLFILANAFRVESSADREFANNILNQRLLYHFTYPCNILGILREGLQVAPRHIYSKNRYPGDGICFWNSASIALSKFKSLPSRMKSKRKTLVLLVCCVALGDQPVEIELPSHGGVKFLTQNRHLVKLEYLLRYHTN